MKKAISGALALISGTMGVLLTTPALAAAPATQLLTGTLVTPSSAFTYYGASTTHTVGLAIASSRSPEIKALARTMSRGGSVTGDVLAQRVASYVRSNIRVEFRFGLGKGSRGAVIDQSGTPFDQADAMVQILREAGATANYQLGTITLTPDQFGKWTGLVTSLNEANQTFTVNAQAACQFLADGGIPATVNGSSTCTGLTGNLTTVTIAHLWVVTGGKAYDPSFKQYKLRAGIDIAAGMGCGTDAAPTCGSQVNTAVLTGASQGTAFGAPYIQTLNRAQLETKLASYATALQPVIKALGADAPVETATGGAIPDDSYAPVAGATLPYQASTQASWTGDIPNPYRTKLRIRVYGADQTFYADELSGNRVRILASAAANTFNRTGGISVEGTIIQQTSTAVANSDPYYVYTLDVDYPYAAATGAYADSTFNATGSLDPRDTSDFCIHYTDGYTQCNVSATSTSYVVFQLGAADLGQVSYYNGLMGNDREVYSGADGNPQYTYERPINASRWLVQASEAQNLIQNIAKANITPHASIGVAFGMYAKNMTVLNVETAFSVSDRNANAANRLAAFQTAAAVNAVLEGSVRQQSEDSIDNDSASSWFRVANDKNYRFYQVNSSNVSTVFANSAGYDASRQSLLTGYVADGLNLILPINGSLGTVSYGIVNVILPMGPAFGFDGNRAANLVADRYKGGTSLDSIDPFRNAMKAVAVETASLKSRNKLSIDPSSGTFSFQPPPDINLGSGDLGLSLQRMYSSASNSLTSNIFIPGSPVGTLQQTPVGHSKGVEFDAGWNYNLKEVANWSADTNEAFGSTSALRATGSIASIGALLDLNRTTALSRQMATLLATDYLNKQLIRNSFTVTLGSSTFKYIKLPDGTFDAPADQRGSALTITGAITPVYFGGTPSTNGTVAGYDYSFTNASIAFADGTVRSFMPAECSIDDGLCLSTARYIATATTLANGFKRTATLPVRGTAIEQYFKGLTNSAGYNLTLTAGAVLNSDAPYIIATHASDNLGNTVDYGCSMIEPHQTTRHTLVGLMDQCAGYLTFKDVAGNISRATYVLDDEPNQDSDRHGPIKALYLPSGGTTTAFYQFGYDMASHLATVTDGASHVTTVYTGSVSSERSRLGETVAADGGVTSTLFNQHGKPLVVTDPLGRQTVNSYDVADRLLRTVNPEGDAVEYQYDIRGNVIRECRISKTATPTGRACDPLLDLVTTTTYMEGSAVWTCVNAKICNKPATVIDPKGIMAQYTWSTTHGQVLTETKGLNSSGVCQLAGGVCPVTTYGYTSFTGTDSAVFYLLTSKQDKIDSTNTTTTTWGYANAANHFALREQVVDSGGLSLRSCFTSDAAGNIISQTAPRAGLASCP